MITAESKQKSKHSSITLDNERTKSTFKNFQIAGGGWTKKLSNTAARCKRLSVSVYQSDPSRDYTVTPNQLIIIILK